MRKSGRFGLIALGVLLGFGGATAASAQEDLHPSETGAAGIEGVILHDRDPKAYGLAALTVSTSTSWDFTFYDYTRSGNAFNQSRRFCTGAGTCFIEAPVRVPSGASIVSFEVEACDSVAANWNSALYRNPLNGDFVVLGSVGSTGTPGCVVTSATLGTPAQVDNANNTYMFEWNDGGANASGMSLRALRVRYRLNVSPAPGVATFTDVPTTRNDFRFVEALFRAGVVGGCGGSNFCPDSNITRGEFAVFISALLGLHFPN